MTETLVSREGKMEAAMRVRERDMQSSLDGNKKSTAQPSRWTIRRALGWGLILALLVPLIVGVIGLSSASATEPADPPADDSETSSELANTSFYEMSAEMMSFFSERQDPQNGSAGWGTGSQITNNPGTAGSFLGYLDVSIVESPSRWALSQLSGSSDAMGYDNLLIYGTNGDVMANQAFQDYAYFGATLNGLGFDSTSTGLSMNLGGQAMGFIMWLTYHVVYLVDIVFWLFMNLLQALNPFRLFYLGLYATSPELADGMTGGAGATKFELFSGTPMAVETNALSGLVNWIGGWYQVLAGMAWTVMVPLFMGVFLIGLVLFKKMDKGSALRRLLIRLLFIGFGLPLMGSMYSATLDTLTDGLGAGNRGATQVVLSTYVDFEAWATNERLALPNGAVVGWDRDRNQPTGDSEACARNTALEINNRAHGLNLTGPITACGKSGGSKTPAVWSGSTQFSKESEGLLSSYKSASTTGNRGSAWSMSEAFADDVDDAAVVRDMLGRYMRGSQVTAASFETEVKGRMVSRANAISAQYESAESSRMTRWFTDIADGDFEGSNPEDADRETPLPALVAIANNPLVSIATPEDSARGLMAERNNNVVGFSSHRDVVPNCGAQVWSSQHHGFSHSIPAHCNMAPLAMYNYLNTGFDATSLTVYSSGNVMSEATREIHNSVNSVGTGVMSFLYWMNSISLLGAFIVVGLTYAMAMLFGAIKRGFQLISAIPFATLGAIAGIAKVLIYSFALVFEVLLTIFVYLMVQEFLLSLPQIIETPLVSVLGNLESLPGAMGSLSGLLSGSVLAMIVPVFSIVSTIVFTIVALKLRKTVIKAADEAVTKLVEKFLDTNATPATAGAGSGLGQGIASGVGAGAGAAAANRLMTGGAGPKGSNPNVSGTNGPSGIASGSGGPGGGKGDGLRAVGAGGTTALLGAGGSAGANGSNDPKGPNGSGGDGGSEDPNDPNRPSGSMGYASDDQRFGERVRESGLSMDGQGYGPASANDSERTTSLRGGESSQNEKGARVSSAFERSAETNKNNTASSEASQGAGQASTGRPVVAGKDAQGAGEKFSSSQADSQSSSARDEARTASTNESSGHQISAEDSRRRQDSGATSTSKKEAEAASESQRTTEAQHQSESETERNNAQGPDALAAAKSDRGPTNIGGTNSNLSSRERAEAQAAAERAERSNTETASSESQSQRAHDAEQNTDSAREIQAGDNQKRESSQASVADQSRERTSDSMHAERDSTATPSRTEQTAASEQNSQTDVRPVSGASVENTSNESKVKQQGGEEKLNQDNRTDQKNFDEQKIDQDNSSEQTVDAKSVTPASETKPSTSETKPERDTRGVGVAGAAAAGAGAGITSSKAAKSAAESGVHGVASPSEKKVGARSASTPTKTKTKTPPPSTLHKSEPQGTKETATAKAPTRSGQAGKGALSGAVKGGGRGAVVGAVKGGATGALGGPVGIAAGAARGAAVGGTKGVVIGAATGSVKGAVKKPQAKAPTSIKRGVAPSAPTASAPAKQTPQGPATAGRPASAVPPTPSTPRGKGTSAPKASTPNRAQPPKGRVGKAQPAPSSPSKPTARAQPPKSAASPTRPLSPGNRAQPPKNRK